MTYSAFGVDHGHEIYKKRERPKEKASGGRLAAGALFSPIHGVVAGKGAGGKAKAGATELGTGAAGSVAGALVGRGRGGGIGSTVGGLGGGAGGAAIAHRRGWLKQERKD